MWSSLLIILLTNIFLFLASFFLGIDRPLFNFDYFFVLLLLVFRFKKIATVLFFVTFLSDIFLLIQQVFPFSRIEDIVYISKYIWFTSIYYQLLIFIIFSIMIILIILMWKLNFEKTRTFVIFILFSIVYCSEVLYGSLVNSKHNFYVSSQLVSFINLQFSGFNQAIRSSGQSFTVLSEISPSTKELNSQLNAGTLPNKILFIIAESLGYPKDPLVLESILNPLLKENKRIENFRIESVSYTGATVQAEMRELCQMQINNFNFKNINNGFENCLPNKLKNIGYKTIAIHGALGLMYDRKYWYPRVGFDDVLFRESRLWETRCYSFPGVCDRELANYVADSFIGEDNQFTYWLTLNSHAIYDLRDLSIDLFDCKKYGIYESSESCRNFKLQTQFFYILSDLLNKPQMKNVEVIVVGDHTPAILDLNEKKKYFGNSNVMLLKFNIK